MKETCDIAVIGAGAAGILAALSARGAVDPTGAPRTANRELRVHLLDSMESPGKKILISGGGRCNLTNVAVGIDDFVTSSPNAAKSVLREFPPEAIRNLMHSRGVGTRVEPGGKVFPSPGLKARNVLDALMQSVHSAGVVLRLGKPVVSVEELENGWRLNDELTAGRLILASGGKSVPQTGSTGFGFEIAERLGHRVVPPEPALVALRCTLPGSLAGLTLPTLLTARDGRKRESAGGSLLFTHHGISGPAALDASLFMSRMGSGAKLTADFWTLADPNGPWAPYRSLPKPPGACLRPVPPGIEAASVERFLIDAAGHHPKQQLATVLCERLPKKLVDAIVPAARTPLSQLSREVRRDVVRRLTRFDLDIQGTEGFRAAEVTSGGVSLAELHRKTLESRSHPGLHFCGEILDVTGRLGGFNFQWAWSSGFLAGRAAASNQESESG